MAKWAQLTKNSLPADKQKKLVNFLRVDQLLHPQGLSLVIYSPFGIEEKEVFSKQFGDLTWCSVSSTYARKDS